jgi:hypothetical protein
MESSMKRPVSFCFVFAFAACGDNARVTSDAPPGQGSGDGAAAACSGASPLGVVVSGDFKTTGTLATIDPLALTMTQNAVAGVAGSDPYLRRFGCELFIVNRFTGDNVTILDASTLQLVDQLATGASSNPQDVAVHGNKLYVPALGTTGVVVLTRGQPGFTTIDLGTPLGDPDGHPDCVTAYTAGDRVFVACGLLDENDPFLTPRGPGKVAVIDTASDTVVASFALPYKNPQNMFVPTPAASLYGGDLLVSTIPDFQDYSTGCIARVTTGPTPGANGCAVTNAALHGFLTHGDVQQVADGALLWMAVGAYDASFNASGWLTRLDLTSGAVDAQPVSPSTELVVDVAVCPGDRIIVADHTFGASGLRVYQGGVERTTAPLPIGLPPAYGNNTVCFAR